MDTSQQIANELLTRYSAIMSKRGNTPEWAVHKRNTPDELVKCTIPFIGKHYCEQPKKILVYASAENLAGYYPGNDEEWTGDWLDDDVQATNRHRRCLEDTELQKMKQGDSIIPYVHLGPMESGGLLTAAMYIASKLYNIGQISPHDFCETISFGNYGKYSVETDYQRSIRTKHPYITPGKWNIDYADNREKLFYSAEYVRADIETLRPDYIIIPKQIYEAEKIFIDGIKDNAIIVPIYQMLSRNINTWIAPSQRHKNQYKKYTRAELSKAVQNSYDYITGFDLNKYLYVFGYLDAVLGPILNFGE